MDREVIIKKIIYQVNHRGCKELDILLPKIFTAEKLQSMPDDELVKTDELLKGDDEPLYELIKTLSS